MIAQILSVPWIMARKPGKLPGETISLSYELEYGSNTLEIQKSAIQPGDKIAIVDDLLATGGTALACIKLVESLGGVIDSCAFVIALDEVFLLGQPSRKQLQKYNCQALVRYN
jgi:adenine phosphoribosyltransferase